MSAVSNAKRILQMELADRDEDSDLTEGEELRGAVGGGDNGVLESNIVGYPESDDDDNTNVREVEGAMVPNELLELKRQLNILRNEFSQVIHFLCNQLLNSHIFSFFSNFFHLAM